MTSSINSFDNLSVNFWPKKGGEENKQRRREKGKHRRTEREEKDIRADRQTLSSPDRLGSTEAKKRAKKVDTKMFAKTFFR